MNKYEASLAIPDTALLLTAISERRRTRRDIADLYGIAIRIDFGQTDWSVVNHAIMDRWSISGLKWIKRLAWGAVEKAETV